MRKTEFNTHFLDFIYININITGNINSMNLHYISVKISTLGYCSFHTRFINHKHEKQNLTK